MNVYPITMNSTSTSASASSSPRGIGDMYMTLLMTQLKYQSPLEPMDPGQFVGQLAQFNTLNEIIQIREMLQSFGVLAANTATKGVK